MAVTIRGDNVHWHVIGLLLPLALVVALFSLLGGGAVPGG